MWERFVKRLRRSNSRTPRAAAASPHSEAGSGQLVCCDKRHGLLHILKHPFKMHRVTFQVVVLLAWCFVWSTCQVEANSVNRRFYRHAIRLCSKSLSDALSLVCKDGYAGFEQQQPGGTSAETHHKGANHEPGIVELCCYQPCNIETLEQYCIKPVAHPKT